MSLQKNIEQLLNKSEFTADDHKVFEDFKAALRRGEIRAAEKDSDGNWNANAWVKQGILLGFKMGAMVEMSKTGESFQFFDKETYPLRPMSLEDKVRIVPGGSTIRDGSYIAPGVVCMPPMYVNVGAYVDEGTMIDSHALVGSCAQIGKRVHISAAAQIGGVLEPVNANPVVIEDDCLIGGNTGVYEGVIIREKCVLASGVILTRSTPVFDLANEKIYKSDGTNRSKFRQARSSCKVRGRLRAVSAGKTVCRSMHRLSSNTAMNARTRRHSWKITCDNFIYK